jgi:hypothetical protein
MSLSRVDSRKRRQENEQGRSKQRRLFAIILLCLVAILILSLGVFFQGERLTGWVSGLSKKPSEEQRSIHNVPTPSMETEADAVIAAPDASQEPGDSVLDGNEQDSQVEGQADNEQEIDNEQDDVSGEPAPADSTTVDEGQTVQLAFVGDLLPGEYIQTYLTNEGVSYPYEKALFHLTSADITAGNLELPITTVNKPAR